MKAAILYLYVGLGALIVGSPLYSQDIHWSQFGNAPMEINPALVGNFRGDIRIGVNLRTQWNNVPVGYETYSAWADASLRHNLIKKGRLGVGLLLSHDQAGYSDLRSILVRPNISYTHALTDSRQRHQHQLSIGLAATLFDRQYREDDLQFDSQYRLYNDGRHRFDPSAPTNEDLDMRSTGLLTTIGSGINYMYQNKHKRTKFNIGLGVFNFPSIDVSFFDQTDVMLPIRYSVYGLGVWHLTEHFDLLTDLNWQYQGTYDEVVLRPALRIHLNRQHTRESSLDLGFRYRLYDNSDAIVPDVCLNFRQFTVGLTYDITLSEFTEANRGRGGPEVSVVYRYTKVRPIPVKICPVY